MKLAFYSLIIRWFTNETWFQDKMIIQRLKRMIPNSLKYFWINTKEENIFQVFFKSKLFFQLTITKHLKKFFWRNCPKCWTLGCLTEHNLYLTSWCKRQHLEPVKSSNMHIFFMIFKCCLELSFCVCVRK